MRYLYAVKDALIGFGSIQGLPMIIDLPNDDVARRVVQDACANGQKPNAFNVHPEHKEMWRLGSINEETGVITALEPYCVARASDYIGKETIVDENNVNETSGASVN